MILLVPYGSSPSSSPGSSPSNSPGSPHGSSPDSSTIARASGENLPRNLRASEDIIFRVYIDEHSEDRHPGPGGREPEPVDRQTVLRRVQAFGRGMAHVPGVRSCR